MARILLFDRDVTRRLQLLRALAGHDVRGAAEHNEALQTVVMWRPHLILADWFDSDGPKLIEELHKVFAGPSLRNETPPPVILTTDASSIVALWRYRERALAVGAVDVMLSVPSAASSRRQAIGELHGGMTRANVAKELVLDAASDDVRIVEVMDEPIVRIGLMVGGMDVLDVIIERHGCRRNPTVQRRLADALTAWGSLHELGRLARACEMTLRIGDDRATADPVDATLLDLAQTMLAVDAARHASS